MRCNLKYVVLDDPRTGSYVVIEINADTVYLCRLVSTVRFPEQLPSAIRYPSNSNTAYHLRMPPPLPSLPAASKLKLKEARVYAYAFAAPSTVGSCGEHEDDLLVGRRHFLGVRGGGDGVTRVRILCGERVGNARECTRYDEFNSGHAVYVEDGRIRSSVWNDSLEWSGCGIREEDSASSGSSKDEFIGRENANDLFGTLQILQFEILPSSERPQYNGNATSSSSETGCTQSTSSARYTQSETMTMHTATFTANSVFGKHDSFYRWFSQNDEGRQIDEGSRGAGDDTTSCSDCNDNQDEQASETCHCRSSTFHNRKFRHKKSVSTDDRNLSLPLLHSEYSDSLLNIVSGDLCENWFLKIRDIKEVIRRAKAASQREDWYKSKDKYGNTALLVSGRKLLEEKQFDKAVELVKILLDEGADVNVINHENRTLLSYSISCMDDSIQLTTLLLNYGADVWSMGE
ncbi:hypothetical protein V9T40_006460 [Parthenolecanium corni]|uniref:ANK_REP_REGION domain-containing protein n=1 Tax=Parthenolecanium corni TaxID=536013 RepID=A0AAN9TK38_9HEMI